jgi:hypothetical protein
MNEVTELGLPPTNSVRATSLADIHQDLLLLNSKMDRCILVSSASIITTGIGMLILGYILTLKK